MAAKIYGGDFDPFFLFIGRFFYFFFELNWKIVHLSILAADYFVNLKFGEGKLVRIR